MVRRFGVLTAMLVVIALIIAAGVHNLRARRAALAQNQLTLNPATGTIDEAASPEDAASQLRGKSAPSFTLPGTNGSNISLSQYKGHPVLVNFWATWCGPCKLEMPWIEEFSNKYKSQGFVVLGLSQDLDTSPKAVQTAAQKIGVSYPILMSNEKTAHAYGGLDVLPESFYLDKSGKVVDVTAGAPTKDQMEALIQKTIASNGE